MAEDRIRGMADVPLNEAGIRQGIKLAQRIRSKGGVTKVISSPLSRAKSTANLVVGHVPGSRLAYSTSGLEPWHLGQFEGQPSVQAYKELENYVRNPTKKVPGKGLISLVDGESFQDYLWRFLPFVQYALANKGDDERVLLMAHYRNLKTCIACDSLDSASVDPNEMVRWPDGLDTGALFHLKPWGDRLVVREIDLDSNDVLPWGGLLLGRHGSTDLNG